MIFRAVLVASRATLEVESMRESAPISLATSPLLNKGRVGVRP
jgi:hypothetical protein